MNNEFEGLVDSQESKKDSRQYRLTKKSTEKTGAVFTSRELKDSKTFHIHEFLLRDHNILGVPVLMGMAHLSLAINWAVENYKNFRFRFKNIHFLNPVILSDHHSVSVRIDESKDSRRAREITSVFSFPQDHTGYENIETATTFMVVDTEGNKSHSLNYESLRSSAIDTADVSEFYLHREQECYGPSLFSVSEVFRIDEYSVVGEISPTKEVLDSMSDYIIHPAILDACHVLASYTISLTPINCHWVPLSIHRVEFSDALAASKLDKCFCRATKRSSNLHMATIDLELFDSSQSLILSITGFTTRSITDTPKFLSSNKKSDESSLQVENKRAFTLETKPTLEDIDPQVEPKRQQIEMDKLYDLLSVFFIDKISEKTDLSLESNVRSKNFMTLGLNSFEMIELIRDTEKTLDIELYPTILFELQNISELAEYLEENYKEKVITYFKGETILGGDETEEFSEPFQNSSIASPHSTGQTNEVKSKGDHYLGGEINPEIAIVGMSGRLPESQDLDEFWEHLEQGKDLVSEVPKERWLVEDWFSEDREKPNKSYSKWGGYIDDVDRFDPLFFDISPSQATWIDPQVRLLLQITQKTFEDAGLIKNVIGSNTGVYIGSCFREYWDEIVRQQIPIVDYQGQSSAMSSLTGAISYAFDLRGPSIPLDNACASSLTALHLGCEAIKNNECDQALIGGVNILISPLHYVGFSRIQALSPSGRCHAFDNKADGYVPAEGVVCILIKRLDKALKDNDNIHAVIKGSAINHNGRSNNPTAPRPELQTELLQKAWDVSGITPDQLNYIEAHGTGTKLGDPIEFNALKTAFEKYTHEKNFCALGSLKAHLGHLEGAAGLGSLVKVVMMLKNRKVPTMPNFSQLNDFISIGDSPFYINRSLEDWNSASRTKPLLAGISSFGMSGNNAHVVVEEFQNYRRISNDSSSGEIDYLGSLGNGYIVPISAQSASQLESYINNLYNYIERKLSRNQKNNSEVNLINIAYTFQKGRQEFSHRIAFIAETIEEFVQLLSKCIDGGSKVHRVFKGVSLKMPKMSSDQNKENKSLEDISQYWVSGGKVSWEDLKFSTPPRYISLPSYPFLRERFWLPDNGRNRKIENEFTNPLVVEPISYFFDKPNTNVSGLVDSKIIFRDLTFSGDEFFLRDHRVDGVKTLPAVGYLEIVRACIDDALSLGDEKIEFRDVLWARPLQIVEDSQRIRVEFKKIGSDEFDFIFHKLDESFVSNDVQKPFCQGSLKVSKADTEVRIIDLESLRKVCHEDVFASKDCYNDFDARGLHYGASHQGLGEVYRGAETMFAKVNLPNVLMGSLDYFGLHPSLLDSALQATILLGAPNELFVPFSLGALIYHKPCTSVIWAAIRLANVDESSSSTNVSSLDIDLCSSEGEVLVSFVGLKARRYQTQDRLTQQSSVEKTQEDRLDETWLLKKDWVTQNLSSKAYPIPTDHLVILIQCTDSFVRDLSSKIPDISIRRVSTDKTDTEEKFLAICLELSRVVLAYKVKVGTKPSSIQCIVDRGLIGSISGLCKSIELETPNCSIQLIEIDGLEGYEKRRRLEDLSSIVIGNLKEMRNREVRYHGVERRIPKWIKLDNEKPVGRSRWRDDGVYLITGGAGGIGLLIAEQISRRHKAAKIILTGRSTLTEKIRRRIEDISANFEYIQSDISDSEATEALIEDVLSRHNRLNGVFHFAGVLRDSLMQAKRDEEFSEVFKPKVSGALNLDAATSDIPLDLFIMFSSVTGAFGNIGQGDYAAANSFLANFANHRQGQVLEGSRRGWTKAIDWPLWENGGMQVSDDLVAEIVLNTGLVPLKNSDGISAFFKAIDSSQAHLLVLSGKLNHLESLLTKINSIPIRPADEHTVSPTQQDQRQEEFQDELRLKTLNFLKEKLGEIIELSPSRIDGHQALEKYGLDSIVVVKFTDALRTEFGSISRTLLFEYQTLDELSIYLADKFSLLLIERFYPAERLTSPSKDTSWDIEGHNDLLPDTSSESTKLSSINMTRNPSRLGSSLQGSKHTAVNNMNEEVAIIGLAGRYPMANNIDEFWENLKEGKDCISPVPEARWDHSRYYETEKGLPGTTYCQAGGFIDDVDKFDSLFFNISPRHAEIMDPQERLFLECSHAVIEDAGYTKDTLLASEIDNKYRPVGVYVGVMYEEYQFNSHYENHDKDNVILSGNPAAIANRVSYYFNFHGPSMAIDTMCSSSLSCIHLASQSIRNGECKLAIAGGVNVSIHPNKYLFLAQGNFISSNGRCESFGKGGDGYVPGEGVGAVLLKPLAKAIADNDNIYGVVKSTAINHGGKTNGYTVPNPVLQSKVISQALENANCHPDEISYIEAHGTGTVLGDPIEISGLEKAFDTGSTATLKCAIGSVKSNIGHCESAAGIAALTKVLLQIKHRKIAPSLHASELNPNIDFENSRFELNQSLTDWKAPRLNGQAQPSPLIAGISAFGAGGSNAHVIISEYVVDDIVQAERPLQTPASFWFVFSAHSRNTLVDYANIFLKYLDVNSELNSFQLCDLTYTLQVGREAMVERVAIVAKDIETIRKGLNDWLSDNDNDNVFSTPSISDSQMCHALDSDPEMSKAIDANIKQGRHELVLPLWCRGVTINWDLLYHETYRPRRVSMPTYPFLRERHWIAKETFSPVRRFDSPLLEKNTSTQSIVRFSSTLVGDESFLVDHQVKGKKILPASAFLEMAFQAIDAAFESKNKFYLENVNWLRSCVVEDSPCLIHISIDKTSQGGTFVIYLDNMVGAKKVDLCKGSICFSSSLQSDNQRKVDISALKELCNNSDWTAEKLYSRFRSMGISYGKTHRNIESLLCGDNQVFAKLILNDTEENEQRFKLHPGLLDSAMQASLALFSPDEVFQEPFLPFEMKTFEIFSGIPPQCFVWVTGDSNHTTPETVTTHSVSNAVSIVLMNERGEIVASASGLVTLQSNVHSGTQRPLVFSSSATSSRQKQNISIRLSTNTDNVSTSIESNEGVGLIPIWERFNPFSGRRGSGGDSSNKSLLLFTPTGEIPLSISKIISDLFTDVRCISFSKSMLSREVINQSLAKKPISHVIWWANDVEEDTLYKNRPSSKHIIDAQKSGAIELFSVIKCFIEAGYHTRALEWTIVTRNTQKVLDSDQVDPTHSTLSGLVGSLANEYRHWHIRVLDVDDDMTLSNEFFELQPEKSGQILAHRYNSGGWHIRRLKRIKDTHSTNSHIYRQGGIYLILGGAGGIGEAWSEYLVKEYQCQVIWIGRRDLNQSIDDKLNRIGKLGPRPVYYSADASNFESLREVQQKITKRFKKVDGIIHSAIVLDDSTIGNMNSEQFQGVLSSKVNTSVNLVDLFAHENLDFILFFSSMMSFFTNVGQANYSAGSTFIDSFGAYIGSTLSCPVKVINWGYWGNLGIVADDSFKQKMADIGIGSIEPAEAWERIDYLLNSHISQLAYMRFCGPISDSLSESLGGVVDAEAHQNRITNRDENSDGKQTLTTTSLPPISQAETDAPLHLESIKTIVRESISKALKLEASLISDERAFSDYGVDSIVGIDIVNGINRESGITLPTIVLFDYSTVDKLSSHILEEYSPVTKNKNVMDWPSSSNVNADLPRKTSEINSTISHENIESGIPSEAVFEKRDEILYGLLLKQFLRVGLFESWQSIKVIEAALGLAPQYKRWLTYSLYLLTQVGYLRQDMEKYQVTEIGLAASEIGMEEWNVFAEKYPSVKSISLLVRNTIKAIIDVISGESLATDILFPNRSFALVEGFYSQNPIAEYFNNLLAKNVRSVIEKNEISNARIFEIGAGTGSTSAAVLAELDDLKGRIEEYCYSDLSKAFLIEAESRLNGHSNYLRCQVYDAESPPSEQDISSASYDVVIAANVLHATKDIRETLTHARSLLNDSGRLFIIELEENSLLMHLTFGLLEGWWRFDDEDTRSPGGPAMTSVQWRKVLRECGFKPVKSPTIPHRQTGLQFIEAELNTEFYQKNDVDTSPSYRGETQRESPSPVSAPLLHSGDKGLNYKRALITQPGAVDFSTETFFPNLGLDKNQVRISTRAFSINFGDLLCVKGLYPTMPPYPFTPGFEASGIIVEAGSDSGFQVGDRVVAIMGESLGAHANMIVCGKDQLWRLPESLSFEHACALPTVGMTALDAFFKASPKSGEKILIQTATGGTGLIAIQLAKYFGLEIFATASRPSKLEYLKDLGVDHCINYMEEDFSGAIQRITHGNGVDIILNMLPGDAMQRSLPCLAPGGRYIEIAMTALKGAKAIDLSFLSNNQSIHAVDLRKKGFYDYESTRGLMEKLFQLVKEGHVTATISKIFSFDEIEQAYSHLENRDNIGKAIVSISNDICWTLPETECLQTSGKSEQYPSSITTAQSEGVAVIGISARFAGASDAKQLWEKLKVGADLVTAATRWETLSEDKKRYGSFVENIDLFDPGFFEISGLEAQHMDPQQRLFLEQAWVALEDAGYASESINGQRCGVYVGCQSGDYHHLLTDDIPAQAFWGNAGSVIPARIAYHLDLRGPAIAIDTACSSSLLAIHQACTALKEPDSKNREIDMAIAGGVFIQSTERFYEACERANMLSETGRCYTFDARADGFVPGEGVGVVILKRLDRALLDNDNIWGVIKGSASNQDGASNGITAPSAISQEELERTVYDRYSIDPRSIQMVEAHGTGTKLGDPIEVRALTKSFQHYTKDKNFCALGSIKTNIGHTATASGVAGVLKILLSFKNRQIPPSINFNQANAGIDFNNSPFYVNTELKDWSLQDDHPMLGAVSSFGFSGTNVHMVIEEAPRRSKAETSINSLSKPAYLVVLSAKSDEQVDAEIDQLIAHLDTNLDTNSDINLRDVSYTLLEGRQHFSNRFACVVENLDDLKSTLKSASNSNSSDLFYRGRVDKRPNAEKFSSIENKARNYKTISEPSIYIGVLNELARGFIKGYKINFAELFSRNEASRISLPTYPFNSKSYWAGKVQRSTLSARGLTPKAERTLSCYQKTWKELPKVELSEKFNYSLDGTILILASDQTSIFSSYLKEYLSQRNIDCLIVDSNDDTVRPEKSLGCIDITGLEYLPELSETNLLWTRTIRDLIKQSPKSTIRLVQVTSSLEFFENTQVQINGAERVGLYRMLNQEYSHVSSIHIDTDINIYNDSDKFEQLAQQIMEGWDSRHQEPEICFRKGKAYVSMHVPATETMKAWKDNEELDTVPCGDENAVLCVTGGTRGLGLLCAKHFVRRHGVRKLALMGKEEIPSKEKWAEIALTRPSSSVGKKILEFLDLEKQGVTIEIFSGSLSDRTKVTEFRQRVNSTLGPIFGVLHCAGALDMDNPAFVDKTIESINRVIEPKIFGLNTLHEVFSSQPLKFFILFSSISTQLPQLAVGLSDYVLGNTYMDYFSENQHRLNNKYYLSLQWPNWRETGMGEVDSEAYRQSGLLGMNNEEGLFMLDNLLRTRLDDAAAKIPLVINGSLSDGISTGTIADLTVFDKKKSTSNGYQIDQNLKNSNRPNVLDIKDSHQADKNIDQPILQPENDLLAEIKRIASETLELPLQDLNEEQSFREWGVDSILLVKLAKRIETLIDAKIDANVLIENSSLSELCSFLEINFSQEIDLFRKNKKRINLSQTDVVKDSDVASVKKSKNVAVVGLACHFPGANSIVEFWQNLKDGKDSIVEVDSSRWDSDLFFSSQVMEGKTYSKWGGFLDSIENFDAAYFNIPESLATQIDPLERQWLEVSVEAIADAGYGKDDLWGQKIGVYAGSRVSNFGSKISTADKQTIVGVGQNFITAHLAHLYNLKGPNMVVDTACSSSLTAIHLAVQSIRSGETQMCLAGGVDILLDEQPFIAMSQAEILSPDGRSKTFDDSANGIGVGEGCGVLVLKSMDKALEDGNRIYAVIEGTAVNNDGNTMGITTPNVEAQIELLSSAILDAAVSPETISYVETHGTGTQIGDPIELRALARVLGETNSSPSSCGVGSVKSNIGHLLSAGGSAGIIKAILSILHGELPQTLHCKIPNPRFNFGNSPLYVVQSHETWKEKAGVRRAGVSAFGLGGNNAHIIVSNWNIPSTHTPTLSAPGIKFERKYYWPETNSGSRAENDSSKIAFMKFFDFDEAIDERV